MPASSLDERLDALADLFRLMGDPNRLRILHRILQSPVAVGEIAAEAGLSQSLVSHNLRLLRACRLVRAERRGRQVFYEPADHHVRSILTDMIEHVGETDHEIEAAAGPSRGPGLR